MKESLRTALERMKRSDLIPVFEPLEAERQIWVAQEMFLAVAKTLDDEGAMNAWQIVYEIAYANQIPAARSVYHLYWKLVGHGPCNTPALVQTKLKMCNVVGSWWGHTPSLDSLEAFHFLVAAFGIRGGQSFPEDVNHHIKRASGRNVSKAEKDGIISIVRDNTSNFPAASIPFWMHQAWTPVEFAEVLAYRWVRNGGVMFVREAMDEHELLIEFKIPERSQSSRAALKELVQKLAQTDQTAASIVNSVRHMGPPEADWDYKPPEAVEAVVVSPDCIKLKIRVTRPASSRASFDSAMSRTQDLAIQTIKYGFGGKHELKVEVVVEAYDFTTSVWKVEKAKSVILRKRL